MLTVESVSQSIKVTVTDPVGKVPEIELSEVADTISYMGSALSIPLRAEASDPDGEVAYVEFYVNGELIQEDNARPFEASLEINATGYLEVYATARDNVGNITTSNVQGILVNSGGVEETMPLEVSFPGSSTSGRSARDLLKL